MKNNIKRTLASVEQSKFSSVRIIPRQPPRHKGEMIANFVSDVLFAEDNSLEKFVNELTEEKKKTFGDFVRDFINWIKGIFGKADEVS